MSAADERRAQMSSHWERAAAGWERRADEIRDHGMAVSAWMVEQLALNPGERLLELAAGPGDTGFLAAEQVLPGGTLICSDGSEAMLELARVRAAAQGIRNVEFKQLELEWIDLATATIDAILCRWGIMLCLDPAAALQECRRVLAAGGRLAMAVWDLSERNPWVTIPSGAMVALGHIEPPDPDGPGMFALAAPGRLADLLGDAGFVEVTVEPVRLERSYRSVEVWLAETRDLSPVFGDAWAAISDEQRAAAVAAIEEGAAPFTAADGSITLPGSSLAAIAHA
jgi:SAM-dependent methyltransferase